MKNIADYYPHSDFRNSENKGKGHSSLLSGGAINKIRNLTQNIRK